MSVNVQPIVPGFGARLSNIDLTQPISTSEVDAVVAALDEYAVVVFSGQPVTQDQQVEFASRLGPLDFSTQKALATFQTRLKQSALADISNVDASGKVAERTHGQSVMNIGNMQWHSDASYMPYPFRYSILACQTPASWGGQTQFADLRAAYDSLDEHLLEAIEGRTGSFLAVHGRDQLGIQSSAEVRNMYPPVKWPLIRTHPATGRKVLWIGTPLYEIEGLPVHEARMLKEILLEHATQRERVYSHTWKADDLIVWDNRSVLHRGRWFDLDARREMRRAGTTDNVGSIDAPEAEKPVYPDHLAA